MYAKVLRKIAMKQKNGIMWLVGTPNGRNYAWRQANRAKQLKADGTRMYPHVMSWEIPAYGCEVIYDPVTQSPDLVRKPHEYENTDYSWEQIYEAFLDDIDDVNAFRVEVLAEFLDAEGNPFHGVEKVCTLADTDVPAVVGHYYKTGIDIGIDNDFFVASVMDAETCQEVFFQRFNGRDWPEIYPAIVAIHNAYPGTIVVDATGIGDAVQSNMSTTYGIHIEEFKFGNANKAGLVTHLQGLITHKKCHFQKREVACTEMQLYQKSKLPSGMIRYSAPPGKGSHDDTCIARMLSCKDLHPSLSENTELANESIFSIKLEETQWLLPMTANSW